MAGRRLSPGEVHELLEGERRRVLREIETVAARDERAREKETERRRAVQARVGALLLEGRDLRIPVVEMAQALGVTRQMAHRLIRDAEDQSNRKEGRDA